MGLTNPLGPCILQSPSEAGGLGTMGSQEALRSQEHLDTRRG